MSSDTILESIVAEVVTAHCACDTRACGCSGCVRHFVRHITSALAQKYSFVGTNLAAARVQGIDNQIKADAALILLDVLKATPSTTTRAVPAYCVKNTP